jgi:hypothetical protein
MGEAGSSNTSPSITTGIESLRIRFVVPVYLSCWTRDSFILEAVPEA